MEELSSIVPALGTETTYGLTNGLDVNAEGIGFGAVLAGLVGHLPHTLTNPSNNVPPLPAALHRAAATGPQVFPEAGRASETPDAAPEREHSQSLNPQSPAPQKSLIEVHRALFPVERYAPGAEDLSPVAEGLKTEELPEQSPHDVRFWIQELSTGEGGAEPVMCGPDAEAPGAAENGLALAAAVPARAEDLSMTVPTPVQKETAVDEVKPGVNKVRRGLAQVTPDASQVTPAANQATPDANQVTPAGSQVKPPVDQAKPALHPITAQEYAGFGFSLPQEEQCAPGLEIKQPLSQDPAVVETPVPESAPRYFAAEALPVEDGAKPLSADAAAPGAGKKASKEAAVPPPPVKDSNPAFLSPERPGKGVLEAKPATAFGGQENTPGGSFSTHSAEPLAGTEQKRGGGNPQFSLQDAGIPPENNTGPLSRPATPPDLPPPDVPDAGTSRGPEFRVRVTEVAPQGLEQVFKHAEAGWNRDVAASGEPGRVPLENVPQQFLHEVARRITALQGHHGAVRLQLQLDPPQLGSVAVKLTLSEHKLKVNFYTMDAEVKDLLVTTLPDLKAELGRMGLNLNDAHVFVGQEHGRESEQPPRWKEGFTAPDVPVQAVEETTLAAEGVDLLV